MDAVTRDAVRRRALARCEYCHAAEGSGPRLRFHIEHITARQHGGGDAIENLALACHLCNAHKGPNLSGIDPADGSVVLLFHPRRDHWEEHFAEAAGAILGLTPTGRGTVAVLDMNHPARVALRSSGIE